jgi:hypothetical protein
MQTSDILFNLVSALAGGLILKIWDSFFSTKKESKDSEIALIEKMQIQIDSQNIRIDIQHKRQDEMNENLNKVSLELDTWKEKYYDILKKYNKLLARYLPNHEDN